MSRASVVLTTYATTLSRVPKVSEGPKSTTSAETEGSALCQNSEPSSPCVRVSGALNDVDNDNAT